MPSVVLVLKRNWSPVQSSYSSPRSGVFWWACLSVCLSVCLCVSVWPRSFIFDHIFGTTRPIFIIFLCVLPMAVARSSSGGVMIRYVLSVLWMTSYLLISQGCSRRRRPAEAQSTRSPGLGYKLCAVVPVAGQRTHGTTFRALKVTSQVAAPGAESAVWLSCSVLSRQCDVNGLQRKPPLLVAAAGGILSRQSRAERQNRTKLTVKLQIIMIMSTEHDSRM